VPRRPTYTQADMTIVLVKDDDSADVRFLI
jgi:hypothetical protein